MTDHPMSCYPGHLQKWRREDLIAMPRVPAKDRSPFYDGREEGCPAVMSVVSVTSAAIMRAMSGQITSSTGDQDESHNR